MKDWKTTLSGLLVALPIGIDALIQAYNAGAFTEKTGLQLVVTIGIILWAAYTKDKDNNANRIGGGNTNTIKT